MKITAVILPALLIGSTVYAANCSVSSSGMHFGLYNPLDGNDIETSGTIDISCTSTRNERVNMIIILSPGNSKSYVNRIMKTSSAATPLYYNIYTKKNNRRVWGDGNSGSRVKKIKNMKVKPGRVSTRHKDMYGTIIGGQDVAVGDYSDTITVTIDY